MGNDREMLSVGFINCKERWSREVDVKVLLGLKRFDVLGLAGTFLKIEEVSETGYEWYCRNRGGCKWSSGGMAVLVHMSLELSKKVKERAGVS